MPQFRSRKEKPAARRYKPQDFHTLPPRRFAWMPALFFVLAVGGIAAWYFIAHEARGGGYELILKSTDRAVTVTRWLGKDVAEAGAPIPAGTRLSTRDSQKTVFRYGPSASMRAASQTDFVFTSSEPLGDRKDPASVATLDVSRGRLWLVGGQETRWIVRTPLALVRTQGKITEVKVEENGGVSVTVWQGKAHLVPIKHPDRAATVGDREQASFGPDGTLNNPSPRDLAPEDEKDAWLAWNLLETMGREIHEKKTPAAQK